MRFTVPGPPIPKARPRVFRRGGVGTPARTVRYELLVQMCARTAGVRRIDGPVHLALAFYLPDRRPRDGDNLQKAIQDALNGIAYDDDSQVRSWQGTIDYDPANPRAIVAVEPMTMGPNKSSKSDELLGPKK